MELFGSICWIVGLTRLLTYDHICELPQLGFVCWLVRLVLTFPVSHTMPTNTGYYYFFFVSWSDANRTVTLLIARWLNLISPLTFLALSPCSVHMATSAARASTWKCWWMEATVLVRTSSYSGSLEHLMPYIINMWDWRDNIKDFNGYSLIPMVYIEKLPG